MIKDGVATERIYRTIGGRFVSESDPDAAFLVYPAGAVVSSGDVAKIEGKQVDKPADKAAEKPVNKSGSGLTIESEPRRK